MERFKFINPGRLVDGDLHLKLVKKYPADPIKKYPPCYDFEMRKTGTSRKMGKIRLMIGSSRALPGHIGFYVNEKYRGRHYAARSCVLLYLLARAHGLNALWIACDPTNTASRKTCDLVGARYMETVRIPKYHELYKRGGRYLCRYKINLRSL